MSAENDIKYMNLALAQAREAAGRDEVPIGAVLVDPKDGTVIAAAGNRTIETADPTAHAEILVIRDACRKAGAQRIPDLDLYVTLEPCAMCAAALSFARVRRVVFGAQDPKGGGILHGSRFYEQKTCHHRPEVVSDILSGECGTLLKDFFAGKRQK